MIRERLTKKHWVILALIGVGIAIVAGRYFSAEPEPAAPERQLPTVHLQKLETLTSEAIVSFPAHIESAQAAPLVARMGGRVTAVRHQLGDRVRAAEVVVEIDGRGEANLTRVQVANLAQSVDLLNASERAAIDGAALAITLAEYNLRLAQATSPLTIAGAGVAREQADLAVRSAQLALEDARETGVDAAIRAADIALKNAGLAQDQATINRRLTSAQGSISVPQARLNVESARTAASSTAAQLASQQQLLTTQLRVAQEQVRLQQITSPLAGEVTRFTARLGDYVQPGTVVGEVNAFAGAAVRVVVPTGVHDRLQVGQAVLLKRGDMEFMGTITRIASAPATATGLWQVDIAITSTPETLHPTDLVVVWLPVGATAGDTYFLPLELLVIRQEGAVLFTVDDERRVHLHTAEVVAFHGPLAEIRTELTGDALVVVEGNRTLAEGDMVTITQ